MKIKISLWSLCIVGLMACQQKGTETNSRTTFFDKKGMDTTIKPGDNFFMYANGSWYKTVHIPDDQSGWGSFYELFDENTKHLKEILEEAQKAKAPKGSVEQKIGDYYASAMDSVQIEKLGAEPLKPVLQEMDQIKDTKALTDLLAVLIRTNEGGILGMSVEPDEKNSAKNILCFRQSGLSLPESSYYARPDSAAQAARKGMLKYATALFRLTGADSVNASKQAQTVLALETKLAASHLSPAALRDPQTNYHKMDVGAFEKAAPNVHIANILTALGIKTDSVNVAQPAYYKKMSELLASEPLDNWKLKFKYDYIRRNARLLSDAFVRETFQFDQLFSGQQQMMARWKVMVYSVDANLGGLLGQQYVAKYFTPEAKKRMDELVNNLQKAFALRIKNLDWMSEETKNKATEKLNLFLKKIGYPSKWENYDDVDIQRNDFLSNVRSARLHAFKKDMKKVDQPVDKTEWIMTPPTVNAYYNPTYNEIVFPAGILQFPFFDAHADDAINYGAIGAVIGHEMTHGFDDQGRQYDAKGNMKDWWTKSDADLFKQKATKVIDLYNGFGLLGTHVNGQLTLGENLADIGGLAIAYDAYKLTGQSKADTKIDGFTPDQRFFLGFAQVWRMKDRDESMRMRLQVDAHSPEEFRVNGTVYNMAAFYKAFDIQPDAKLYRAPENRLVIW